MQTTFAQIAGEARGGMPVIFIESGVGIDFGAKALADHDFRPLGLQLRMERRARRALDTMIRPQRLLAIGHLDRFKRPRARMRGGKGAVALWVPILGQCDMVEALGKAIDDRHHGVTVGNRKRAAGAEIVLHVDDQQ